MSNGLDMSLDDLIKQSKSKPKASSAFSSGPTRRAPPPARAMPYPPVAPKAAAAADSPYGVYSEHVAAMAASSPPSVLAAPRVLETGTKLHISNLNPSVTVEDVQRGSSEELIKQEVNQSKPTLLPLVLPALEELFSEVGELKRYSVNYDKDGKSQGSAEVVFVRKLDALDAIERYNGVLLDGNPMQIELVGSKSEPPQTAPLKYNRAFPNYNAIPNSVPQRGGPRGPFHGNGRPGGSGGQRGILPGNGRPGNTGQGCGGRGQARARGHDRNRVQASAADLDAELEKYHAAAGKQK